ncbi:MAG TPA: hypothetical protein VG326_05420 [Tepidisphaeraceae bacterium]|jgi:hypothetical protein|nr:hypothetical protein [Tepidisphaeraceae bacterium]
MEASDSHSKNDSQTRAGTACIASASTPATGVGPAPVKLRARLESVRAAARSAYRWIPGLFIRTVKAIYRLGRGPSIQLYVFGKHPAWKDFIDVNVLPPVPKPFNDFHRRLRPAIEAAYSSNHLPPRMVVWRRGRFTGVLAILNSQDAPNPQAGTSRRSPLIVGSCLYKFDGASLDWAVKHVDALGAYLGVPRRSSEEFLSAVRDAQRSWPRKRRAFTAKSTTPAKIVTGPPATPSSRSRIEHITATTSYSRRLKYAAALSAKDKWAARLRSSLLHRRRADRGAVRIISLLSRHPHMSPGDWFDLAERNHSQTDLFLVLSSGRCFLITKPLSKISAAELTQIIAGSGQGRGPEHSDDMHLPRIQ